MQPIRRVTLATTALLIAAGASLDAQQLAAPDEARTLVVRMVEVGPMNFAFKPDRITVRAGDIVRFTQAGQLPHNVEFKATPDGAALGDQQIGPFLTAKGQTYDLVIDERFTAGDYRFICTPHVAMGMVGVLTVAPATNR